jgi:hypothetical protein
MNNLYRGKSSPRISATSVIFKPLPKENNIPIRENSPNLVTLAASKVFLSLSFLNMFFRSAELGFHHSSIDILS